MDKCIFQPAAPGLWIESGSATNRAGKLAGTGLWANQSATKMTAVPELKQNASREPLSRRQRWAAAVGPWQPLTGRGVAAFRSASWSRLFAYQLVVAVGLALVVVWTVRHVWFPPWERALSRLPDVAEIRDGRLEWPNPAPVRLAENRWADFIVTPKEPSELGQTADLQLEFRAHDLRLNGLAGHLRLGYRPDLVVPLGRIEATARWGAWRWVLLATLGLSTAMSLGFSWWLLATVYTVPTWLVAVLFGRQLSVLGAWRIATAALIPGALFAGWAMLAYGLGVVRLPGFVLFFSLHAAIGWVWLFWGVQNCPSGVQKPKGNPFKK